MNELDDYDGWHIALPEVGKPSRLEIAAWIAYGILGMMPAMTLVFMTLF